MAYFLRGKFKGFYKCGSSECVRDIFRFSKTASNKLALDHTRRDMTSMFGRIWKAETARFTLHPIDKKNVAAGGTVEGSCLTFNAQTFTFHTKQLYGVYGEDFMTVGTFMSEGDPMHDERFLLEVTKDNSPHVGEKMTFRFDLDRVHYKHEVNDANVDTDLVHEIGDTTLTPMTRTTWSERLYYGLGNKSY